MDGCGVAWRGHNQPGLERLLMRFPAMKIPRATRAVVAVSVVGGALTLIHRRRRSSPRDRHIAQSQWAVATVMGVLALASWIWPVVVYPGW